MTMMSSVQQVIRRFEHAGTPIDRAHATDEHVALYRRRTVGADFSGGQFGSWRSWLCEMPHSNFNSASLPYATFNRCDLTDCDFRFADLRHADFSYSTLDGALFEGAQLDGATFTGATVAGATYGKLSLRRYLTDDAVWQFADEVTLLNYRPALPPAAPSVPTRITSKTAAHLEAILNAHGMQIIKVVHHKKTAPKTFTAVLICRNLERMNKHAAFIAGRIRSLDRRIEIIKHGVNINLTASEWRNTPMVTFRLREAK